MAGKRKIQRRLVDGATKGLRSGKLFDYVREKVPDVPTKKIVHTAFLTLTDPEVTDRETLDAIYDLAIAYRGGEHAAPQPSKLRKGRRSPTPRSDAPEA